MENRNSYQENIKNASIKPLDNDALTRFAYLHDDDITRLFEKLHALERRVSELEEKIKSSQKVVSSQNGQNKNPHELPKMAVSCGFFGAGDRT